MATYNGLICHTDVLTNLRNGHVHPLSLTLAKDKTAPLEFAGSYILMGRGNAVNALSGLRCGQTGIRIRVGGSDFLYCRTSRLTSTHPTSYSEGTSFFSEEKRPGREVNHLPPFNAEVRNWCGVTSTRPMRLLGLERKNFTVLDVFRLASFVATNFPIYIFQDEIK